MELRQLEYFHEICRLGSVTATASELNVSQPSVTVGIRKLEEELGLPLFHRANRRLTLTSAGEDFLRDVKLILAKVEDAGKKMRDYRTEPKGVVRIGITPMMGTVLLPPVIARYQKEFPEVEIRVVEEGSLSISTLLDEGRLDLGIMIVRDLPANFAMTPVRRGKIMACLPPEHRLSGRGEVGLSELRDDPFILFREDTFSRQLIIRECRNLGFEPRIVFSSSQVGTVAGLVREGMGIAFFVEDIARTLDSLAVCRLSPRLELETAVVWNRDRYQSISAANLVNAFVGDNS